MKINFGCGKHTWAGWTCIDAVQHPKASRPLDIRWAAEFDASGALFDTVPLPAGCASELHSHHFIEHVYAWEAPALVREWHRLLQPGGLLVVECPNLMAAARNLLDGQGDQMAMWPLYGDPQHRSPFMCHRWGYTPATLAALLHACGFTNIDHRAPQTHGARINRDMRIEARKA